MNVKLVVEYDGTNYHGFQIQPNGNTIQEELERAIKKIVKDDFILYCAGRTDAGVHALGQVCNFMCDVNIPLDNLCIALNGYLPSDIVILSANAVSDNFNSRYSAKNRLYKYRILNRVEPSAILGRYSWHIRKELDVNAMVEASDILLGSHDFKAFTVAHVDECTIRHISCIDIYKESECIYIDIKANAFLRSMVRNIVGTLVEIGLGKRKSKEMQVILDSKDRQNAGVCAPAKGLLLVEIEY